MVSLRHRYQTQSQPKIVTKEIIPTKKKTRISKTFPPKQTKTQSSSIPVSNQMIPTIEQSASDELSASDKSNFTTKNKCILNVVYTTSQQLISGRKNQKQKTPVEKVPVYTSPRICGKKV